MSDSPRSFCLYQTFLSRMQTIGGAALMCVIGIGLSVASLSGITPQAAEGLPLFLVMAAGAGFMVYWWLRSPSSIEWHADGTVSFKAPVRAVRVPVAEIESIRPYGLGFLRVRYSRKKLVLLNQFDEFHEFLRLLRQANSRVELRGC